MVSNCITLLEQFSLVQGLNLGCLTFLGFLVTSILVHGLKSGLFWDGGLTVLAY